MESFNHSSGGLNNANFGVQSAPSLVPGYVLSIVVVDSEAALKLSSVKDTSDRFVYYLYKKFATDKREKRKLVLKLRKKTLNTTLLLLLKRF